MRVSSGNVKSIEQFSRHPYLIRNATPWTPPKSPPSSNLSSSGRCSPSQLDQISIYIDLLNTLERPHQPDRHPPGRRNRNPPLRRVFVYGPPPLPHPRGDGALAHEGRQRQTTPVHPPRVLDIGSGAGFPAVPLKIWAPDIHLTLIESNHKKAAFLREVARALTLTNIDVIADRAETLAARPGFPRAQVVTFRAVERFDAILRQAVTFLAPNANLALLIGVRSDPPPHRLTTLKWHPPIPVPQSRTRVLSIGVLQ